MTKNGKKMKSIDKLRLDGKIAVITGGGGLLGLQHALAIAEAGGKPVLWDINTAAIEENCREISKEYQIECVAMTVDITDFKSVQKGLEDLVSSLGRVDILINNAANDPKIAPGQSLAWGRLENLTLELWQKDIDVGLTGAFICSKVIGSFMAQNGGGVILNIASDLGLIAPDQRIYRKEGLDDSSQPVKPVTYSVIKHGLIGLTKYLATYWADKGIRVNSISPGGVYTNQPEEFVEKLTNLIPMGRMAKVDEYKASVLFLVSEASSYMTGANLVVDGGRTCW